MNQHGQILRRNLNSTSYVTKYYSSVSFQLFKNVIVIITTRQVTSWIWPRWSLWDPWPILTTGSAFLASDRCPGSPTLLGAIEKGHLRTYLRKLPKECYPVWKECGPLCPGQLRSSPRHDGNLAKKYLLSCALKFCLLPSLCPLLSTLHSHGRSLILLRISRDREKMHCMQISVITG